MRFSSIVIISLLVFTAGCLSTATDVRHFSCVMTDRVLKDETAQSEWVEKFLPSKFNLALANSELTIQTPDKTIKLNKNSTTGDKIVAEAVIDLVNSSGDAFPMTYVLLFDLESMKYFLKAQPFKLMAFGQQSGACF